MWDCRLTRTTRKAYTACGSVGGGEAREGGKVTRRQAVGRQRDAHSGLEVNGQASKHHFPPGEMSQGNNECQNERKDEG